MDVADAQGVDGGRKERLAELAAEGTPLAGLRYSARGLLCRTSGHLSAVPTKRFTFDFDSRYRWPAWLPGVKPSSAIVEIDDSFLQITFGPWTLKSPTTNIRGAALSGPYSVPKTIGSTRMSISDRGLTFATNPYRGVCISFRNPVPGIDPFGPIRHPAVTATVADPDGLVAAITDLVSQ